MRVKKWGVKNKEDNGSLRYWELRHWEFRYLDSGYRFLYTAFGLSVTYAGLDCFVLTKNGRRWLYTALGLNATYAGFRLLCLDRKWPSFTLCCF